jgi:putative lipoprotein
MIRLSVLGALVSVSFCWTGICIAQTSTSPGSSPMITGTVTYRVRMALPADAAIDVRLEDVSRADAPAMVVAENIFAAAGKQVPIPFQLPYSEKDIQPNHRYRVRARITVGEKLFLTTTTAYPVITNGAPTVVNMVLQPAGNTPAPAKDNAATVPLRGTNWKLVELNGKPPVSAMGKSHTQLALEATENRYSGSTGCNRMTGGFQLDGDSLHFEPGAMTMMACPDPLMKQEQAFIAALHAVTTYKINGKRLELLAGEQIVARFKSDTP